jgi:hypothetical protein
VRSRQRQTIAKIVTIVLGTLAAVMVGHLTFRRKVAQEVTALFASGHDREQRSSRMQSLPGRPSRFNAGLDTPRSSALSGRAPFG